MKTRYTAMILATAALAIGASSAHAANRYGVACIHNETQVNVPIMIQKGNGSWERYTVSPGSWRSFWERYDVQNENRSQILRIRFDSDTQAGQIFALTYRLPRRAAAGNSCQEGSQYVFKYESANRRFIDLKRRS